MPGAVSAIQTFGDVLGFNSHLHILATDGYFYGNGMFRVTTFRVQCLLCPEQPGTRPERVGTEPPRVRRIQPGDEEAMENL